MHREVSVRWKHCGQVQWSHLQDREWYFQIIRHGRVPWRGCSRSHYLASFHVYSCLQREHPLLADWLPTWKGYHRWDERNSLRFPSFYDLLKRSLTMHGHMNRQTHDSNIIFTHLLFLRSGSCPYPDGAVVSCNSSYVYVINNGKSRMYSSVGYKGKCRDIV